jgi:cytochrome c biogenesis protein CcmG/thiol:disulfide interchange protein DsbE
MGSDTYSVNGDRQEKISLQQRSFRWTNRRIIATVIITIAIILSLLFLLWTQLVTPATQSATISPLIGKPAPDFTLPLLDATNTQSTLHFNSLHGKAIVLNVWASWCIPCRDEAHIFEAAWRSTQMQHIALIGIDFQDTSVAGKNFENEFHITYPSVIDSSGSVAINYGVSATPETFFINTHGIIVGKIIGEVTTQTLSSEIYTITT